MSEHSIALIPKISNYPNPSQKAKAILDWLLSVTYSPQGYAVSLNRPLYLSSISSI